MSAYVQSARLYGDQSGFFYGVTPGYEYPYQTQDTTATPRTYINGYVDDLYRTNDWTMHHHHNLEREFAPAVRTTSIESTGYARHLVDNPVIAAFPVPAISSSAYGEPYDTPPSGHGPDSFSPSAVSNNGMFTSLPNVTPTITDIHQFDGNPDEPIFDDAQPGEDDRVQINDSAYGSIERQRSCTSESAAADTEGQSQNSDSDYQPSSKSRRSAARTAFTKQSRRKANKRSTAACRRTSSGHSSNVGVNGNGQERPFYCPLAPYGCKSTFATKNEWKRHVSTQHMRLSYWLCDQCPRSHGRKSNEFKRKDLFMQHVRRMHSKIKPTSPVRRNKGKQSNDVQDDSEAIEAAKRCHDQTRSPPSQSICPICTESFHGLNSWNKRMEHMGKHFENVKRGNATDNAAIDIDNWSIDQNAESWMVQQGVLLPTEDGSLGVPDEHRE